MINRNDQTQMKKVSMEELQELWEELRARNELWNGMTHHYLQERYGDRLIHVRGKGWFVKDGETG